MNSESVKIPSAAPLYTIFILSPFMIGVYYEWLSCIVSLFLVDFADWLSLLLQNSGRKNKNPPYAPYDGLLGYSGILCDKPSLGCRQRNDCFRSCKISAAAVVLHIDSTN